MRLIYASMILMGVSGVEVQLAAQNRQTRMKNLVTSQGNQLAELIDNDIILASLVNA